VSLWVNTFDTGTVSEAQIVGALQEVFDFRPNRIIEDLRLRHPIYGPAATYGHFGRTPEWVERMGRRVQLFPWEDTSRLDELRTALGI